MKVLLTGGTGLVGSKLGIELVRAGHEVVLVSRSPDKTKQTAPFPHKSIGWDLSSYKQDLNDVQAVIHLAGAGVADKRWTPEYKKTILESRTRTTQSLVDYFSSGENSLKTFISTSAIGFYPSSDTPKKEEDAPGSSFLSQVCQEWEAPIEKLQNVRTAILRVGIVLSKTGGALAKMIPAVQNGGGHLGNGQQIMSWIDIDDLVRMYQFVLENDTEGVFNAVAPKPISNKVLTEVLADVLGVRFLLPAPKFAIRLAVGEMADDILMSLSVSCEKIISKGFKFKYETIKSSLEGLRDSYQEGRQLLELAVWLPVNKSEVFSYLATEKTLSELTPKEVNIEVQKRSTEELEVGTLIDYKMTLNSVPFNWTTKITKWNPEDGFEDQQERGPYSIWIHKHFFEELGDGTLVRDQLIYKVPLGLLGRGVGISWVTNKLKGIFSYRQTTLLKKFYH